MQKHENAIRRKFIPILRPKTKIIKAAQHTLTLVILNHVTLYRVSVSRVALRMESAYFLQGHAGMDLIYIDCELILDALHLGIGVRSAH